MSIFVLHETWYPLCHSPSQALLYYWHFFPPYHRATWNEECVICAHRRSTYGVAKCRICSILKKNIIQLSPSFVGIYIIISISIHSSFFWGEKEKVWTFFCRAGSSAWGLGNLFVCFSDREISRHFSVRNCLVSRVCDELCVMEKSFVLYKFYYLLGWRCVRATFVGSTI